MFSSAAPVKTQAARELLAGPRSILTVAMRMLLINVDGRGSKAELRDIASSLKLTPQALDQLQRDGLMTGLAEPSPARAAVEQTAVQLEATPVPAPRLCRRRMAPPDASQDVRLRSGLPNAGGSRC